MNYFTYHDKKILEVGHVLSHYFPVRCDILDKYEKGKGVINQDVEKFKTKKKYDLIISISTMEHVGWSYGEEKKPEKFSRGINNLKKNLSQTGIIFVTFPIFYNPYITQLIKEEKMPFNTQYFMKRVSFWNEWVEINYEEAMKGQLYDNYYANANILYIGIYSKKKPKLSFPYDSHPGIKNRFKLLNLAKAPYRFLYSFIEYI